MGSEVASLGPILICPLVSHLPPGCTPQACPLPASASHSQTSSSKSCFHPTHPTEGSRVPTVGQALGIQP